MSLNRGLVNLMEVFKRLLPNLNYQILKIDQLRNRYCRLRYYFLKGRTKSFTEMSSSVGSKTISHNMDALNESAAFGMGNRMALLLYPIAAALRLRKDAKVLIVGPRTEDDIFWARALGLRNARGLDLFSYSNLIELGDIHGTTFPNEQFDAVILGWVVSYSSNPEIMISECKRIVKPGGYIAFGLESNPEQRRTGRINPPRANYLNSGKDIAALAELPIMFIHDPEEDNPSDNAVILQSLVHIPL
jgi:hypothetical protein